MSLLPLLCKELTLETELLGNGEGYSQEISPFKTVIEHGERK